MQEELLGHDLPVLLETILKLNWFKSNLPLKKENSVCGGFREREDLHWAPLGCKWKRQG